MNKPSQLHLGLRFKATFSRICRHENKHIRESGREKVGAGSCQRATMPTWSPLEAQRNQEKASVLTNVEVL